MTGILTVLKPGLRTLIVDHGRLRSRGLGVPIGGAADRFSLALGNALVGNPDAAPALEITLVGPSLTADVPLACVLFGAPFTAHIGARLLSHATTFTVEPGETLEIGATAQGVRAYLCVRGGIDGPSILGSRSSLAPLVAGAKLGCQTGRTAGRALTWSDWPNTAEPTTLHILPGGQADWFAHEAHHALTEQTFSVGVASDRMGVRLEGVRLGVPDREMVSEPVCPGTVQVTREGQCIILGVDGQTIGGYSKIAQVISADLDYLGQLRPGAGVRFCPVTLDEATRRWELRAFILHQLRWALDLTFEQI